MQRSWRSQGLLTAWTNGHKRFEPFELGEIRIMVVLRSLGLGLQDCRKAAEAAAPGVLFLALTIQPQLSVGVDAETDRAGRYMDALGREEDQRRQLMMSGAGSERSTYVELLPDPVGLAARRTTEAFIVVDLEVVASSLATAAGRPLFTLVAPKSFP